MYWYSYEIFDGNGELAGGSKDVPVTLDIGFKDFHWFVESYYEAS